MQWFYVLCTGVVWYSNSNGLYFYCIHSLWFFLTFLFQFCVFSGVSGEGSGVTVDGSSLVTDETVATPPAADTKASIFLNY